MKVKNLYYHTTFKRTNMVKLFILSLFLAICSWPRVFIENFTRRNFGERYFLFPMCIVLAAAIAVIPFFTASYGASYWSLVGRNITWYIYLVAFVSFSLKRNREVKREKGVYDFSKFTRSAGIIHPWFRQWSFFGIVPTNRVISIYYEPGVFLLAGIVLAVLQQNLGYVFIISSIIYSLSWSAQYYLGDQFIMNTIDEIICNEELVASFVHNRPPEETKGFEVYGDKPKDMGFRRRVAENMIEDEPAVDVI